MPRFAVKIAFRVYAHRTWNVAIKRDHDIRLLHERFGADNTFGLYRIVSLTESGGIYKAYRPAADIQPLLYGVARRAGDIGDNGTAFPQKSVHERTLARIRRTGENDKRPVSEDPAFMGGGKQRPDTPLKAFNVRSVCRNSTVGYLRLIDIQQMFHPARSLYRITVKLLVPVGKHAAQTSLRVIGRPIGTGIDKIDHGLGRRQVQFAVQECALRELSAPGKTRPGSETRLKDTARRDTSAMSLKLHDILAGI